MGDTLLSEIEDSPPVPSLRIWSLSGAGFVLRFGDEILYIDPWLVPPDAARKTHRVYPPPFHPDAVRKAVALLSTHEHEDHCSPQTILGICRSSGALFMGPESSTKKALTTGCPRSQVVTLRPGDVRDLSASFKLRAVAASDPYEPSALMYLIETPRGNVFHSGDSSYFEGFGKVGDEHRVDVALLNFGKQIPTPERPYYMSADKVASAARDLRARVVVPMHWNLWAETMEDPRSIEPALRARSPATKLVVVTGGEKLEV